jgi:hypothetical protein
MAYISVHVDDCDVLHDIGEKRIIEFIKEQGYTVTKHKPVETPDELGEIAEAIREGRLDDALTAIERVMFPKWKDVGACEKSYSMRN